MIFVSSRELCESACCGDPTCLVYQFCEQPCLPRSPGWGCYNGGGVAGGTCAVNTTGAGVANWTVFARPPPPPAPPPPASCTSPTLPCAAGFADAAWRAVSTPHDFVVEQAFSADADEEHGYLPFNVSWYRKHFTIDAAAAGSVIWIDFDGVYKNSDVWLNGAYLGHQTSGYAAFRYFLHNATTREGAPALRFGGGDNVLAVRVDALSVQEGWFYEGGGIYRHTWLTVADALSVPPLGVYLPSAITGAITSGPLGVLGPQVAATAALMPQTDVANARAVATLFTLSTRVYDAGGALVGLAATNQTLPPGGTARIYQEIALSNVSLWNTESPVLYTVRTVLTVGGEDVDEVATPIGVRSAVWSPSEGFQLNGFKLPLKGFSNHQSFSGCGNALPDRVDEFRSPRCARWAPTCGAAPTPPPPSSSTSRTSMACSCGRRTAS